MNSQIKKNELIGDKNDISLTDILNADSCQKIFSECREFRDQNKQYRIFTQIFRVTLA